MTWPSRSLLILVAVLSGCGGDHTGPVAPSVEVTTSSPRNGQVGSVYNHQLEATGGTGIYAWSVAPGSLPSGLNLSASGLLSGTPSSEAIIAFTVQAVSGTEIGTRQLGIRIQPAVCAMGAQPAVPPEVGVWEWTKVATPLGFTNNEWVRVDPEDDDTWYAGGASGLFVTHDAGLTWEHPIVAYSQSPVEFAIGDACTVYAVNNVLGQPQLVRSMDRGRSWATLYKVTAGYIRSLQIGRSLRDLILVACRLTRCRSGSLIGSTGPATTAAPGLSSPSTADLAA